MPSNIKFSLHNNLLFLPGTINVNVWAGTKGAGGIYIYNNNEEAALATHGSRVEMNSVDNVIQLHHRAVKLIEFTDGSR